MNAITEPNRLGDVLKYEASHLYSRDEVIIVQGQRLSVGTVIGIVTVGGKAVALNPTASDGSQIVAGVLGEDVNALDEDTKSWIIARHGIVSEDGIIWPQGIKAADLAKATAQLKTLGILTRKGA